MTPFTRLSSKPGVGNAFPAQTNCVVKTKYVIQNTATFNPHLMFLHSPGLLVILGYHAFTSIALMMFLLIMARQIYCFGHMSLLAVANANNINLPNLRTVYTIIFLLSLAEVFKIVQPKPKVKEGNSLLGISMKTAGISQDCTISFHFRRLV